MRRIGVLNQKGGVGKTTTVTNLGAALAARGQRVLLVDLDPQTHLTLSMNVEPSDERPSVYDVLTDGLSLDDAALPLRENLWLAGAHINLAAAEMELVSVVGREVILRDALDASRRSYDYVLIDCPPSLGLLTLNVLTAVREVFIPLQPHFLALQGVGKLFETVQLVRDRINPDLVVSGVLFCMYEPATRLAAEVVADLRGFLEQARGTKLPWAETRIFDTVIRRNIKLAECPGHGLTIFDYEPRSNGAADYARLALEVLGELVSDEEAGEMESVPAADPANVVLDEAAVPPTAVPKPGPQEGDSSVMANLV